MKKSWLRANGRLLIGRATYREKKRRQHTSDGRAINRRRRRSRLRLTSRSYVSRPDDGAIESHRSPRERGACRRRRLIRAGGRCACVRARVRRFVFVLLSRRRDDVANVTRPSGGRRVFADRRRRRLADR